jgi:hypothetical protein
MIFTTIRYYQIEIIIVIVVSICNSDNLMIVITSIYLYYF